MAFIASFYKPCPDCGMLLGRGKGKYGLGRHQPCIPKRNTNMKENTHLVTEQVAPTPNDRPPVWPMVIKDMENRDCEGRRKYGTPLQPHNGRDALVDAYQEALDLCVYMRQLIFERDGK